MGPHIVPTKDTGDGLASSLVRLSIAYSAWSVKRGRERFARGESFLSCVKAFLPPTHKPGDIVVMNNLGSHKDEAVHDTMRLAGVAPVPASLLARPQSDRAGLRRTQSPSAKGTGANLRGRLERHRRASTSLPIP